MSYPCLYQAINQFVADSIDSTSRVRTIVIDANGRQLYYRYPAHLSNTSINIYGYRLTRWLSGTTERCRAAAATKVNDTTVSLPPVTGVESVMAH
jgi:hypothetical protein